MAMLNCQRVLWEAVSAISGQFITMAKSISNNHPSTTEDHEQTISDGLASGNSTRKNILMVHKFDLPCRKNAIFRYIKHYQIN